MVVVGVHTVAEVRIPQVEVEKGTDTKVVSSGEVEIRASVGKGSAAAALGTGHVEAGVAEAHTCFVAVEHTRFVGVVVVAELKLKMVSGGYCSTPLTRSKGRVWVSAGVVVVEGMIAELAECEVVEAFGGDELVEMALYRTGSVSVQGLANWADFGKAGAAGAAAGTWW